MLGLVQTLCCQLDGCSPYIFILLIFFTIPGDRVLTSWQSTLPSFRASMNREPEGTCVPVISAINARASASSSGSYFSAIFRAIVASRPSDNEHA